MSPVQLIATLCGLLMGGLGCAILNNWRGASVAWERFDAAFPPHLQTPAPFAGISFYALGATTSVLALLG